MGVYSSTFIRRKSAENYAEENPSSVVWLREASKYRRPPAKIFGIDYAKETVRKNYALLDGNTPREGVLRFSGATVLDSGPIMTAGHHVIEESTEGLPEYNLDLGLLHKSDISLHEAIQFSKVGLANYGHVLIEMIPRLTLNQEVLPAEAPVLVSSRSKSFIVPMLEWAGIEEERVIFFSTPIHVRNLWWPTRNSFHPLNISPHIVPELRRLRGRERMAGRRLFVSRRDAKTRQLVNDEKIFAVLEPLGFEWVAPGDMSFAEQLNAFSECEILIGAIGAAITNLVFMPPGARVIMLASPDAPGLFFWDLAHHAGLDFSVVFGSVEGEGGLHGNFRVDLEAVSELAKPSSRLAGIVLSS